MSMFAEKSKSVKITVMLVASVVLLILILSSIFAYYAVKASADTIYNGVMVGTLNLGGMNKASAIGALQKKYNQKDITVTLDCEGTVFYIYGASFLINIDYEATAQNAVNHGKTGSIFTKIKNMNRLSDNPQNIELAVVCDEDALQYAINENLGEKTEAVQEYSVEIGKNELVVSNGKNGRMVLAQKVLAEISRAVAYERLSEAIKVTVETKSPKPIDANEFLKKYNRPSKDAIVKKDGDEIEIIPEIVGIELNKDEVKRILEKNKNSFEKYTIPAKILYPKITAKDLEAEYVDTVIGSYKTDYSTSSENRKTNIHLASDKINGLVLNPGEVFSFNDVVGPRNEANGYKLAQAYSGNRVVDDLGGGICQVSSTLYNAAVFSDLEIVFRANHTLPVSYTPLGRDATVSYGSIDFKIKNNKETPIKFEILHNGTTLVANVYGRKKYVKDISIETEIVGYVPFSVTEIKDDTMYKGETKTEEAGTNGIIAKSYKVVKENGKAISRTLLAESTYSPKPKVVRVGTKKPKEATDSQMDVSSDGQ